MRFTLFRLLVRAFDNYIVYSEYVFQILFLHLLRVMGRIKFFLYTNSWTYREKI